MQHIPTTILIDDDKMSRFTLRSMLQHYCPEVEIIGECQNAFEASEMIGKLHPSLCFLDVVMPGKTGISMISELDKIKPEIIVVTAHEQYAIQALRLSAADYLLKPIDPSRLMEAVNKAKNRLWGKPM